MHVRHLLLTRPLARKETVHSSTTLTDVPMGRARNASWPPGFPLREAPPEDMFAEMLVVCDGRKAATKGAGSPPPLPLLPLPFPAHRSSEKGVEMLHIFVASPVEAIRPFLLTTFGARCATCLAANLQECCERSPAPLRQDSIGVGVVSYSAHVKYNSWIALTRCRRLELIIVTRYFSRLNEMPCRVTCQSQWVC